MQKIRYGLIVLWLLSCSVTSATAQVSIGIGIGLPNVSIGINLPLFPELVPVPGYPVYYAPQVNANYFFYDGMYWVYQDDYWYASSWYNGPWALVQPEVVPLFILRIPVRYYRQPPVYFRGWRSDASPRWGDHWGHQWEQRRSGWDRWNRGSAQRPAPLPIYQRQYSGDRYPRQVEQQQTLRRQQYRYQPRDTVVRQHLQQVERRAPAPAQRGRQEEPRTRGPGQQDIQRSTPRQQGAPVDQRSQPQHQTAPQQRGPAVQEQRQQPGGAQREQQAPRSQRQEQRPEEQRQQPGAGQREQQPPRSQGQEPRSQERVRPQEPGRGQGQDQDQRQKKDEERGRERNN
jgi:hypothetical protein